MLRIMFMPPAYLAESAWLEHIPFAFWLVEAQRPKTIVELGAYNGPSYFAFCQAVAHLGLDACCFAVDTWKGDEHAGFYGEEVFKTAQSYNDAQYSTFSRLVRSTFDEAVDHFSDGVIDILHIDGMHTLDAVRHDFEKWLPKLSDRAVVVAHDVNVRERGFGVFKFFEEIRKIYPTFEFAHGHGLGVIGVGPHQQARLKRLFEIERDPPEKRFLCEAFARLGRACADSFEARRAEDGLRLLQQSLKERERDAAALKAAVASADAQLAARTADLDEVRAKLREIEAERDALAAEAATASDKIEARVEEIVRLTKFVRDAETHAAETEKKLQDAETRGTAARRELGEAKARAAQTEDDLRQLRRSLEERDGDAALLKASAASIEAQFVARVADLDEVRAKLREIEAERDALAAEASAASARIEAGAEETVRLAGILRDAEARAAETENLRAEFGRLRRSADERTASDAAALAVMREELSHEKRKASRLQEEQKALLTSSSWRLSAPLRAYRRKRSQARRFLRLERINPLFDRAWYLNQYSDVENSGCDPYEHYMRYGAAEGRNPSPLFDASWYLERNPDVRAAQLEPLMHYFEYGNKDGRDPNPYFGTSWYLEQYPDVRKAKMNALDHYIRHGAAEGRNPNPFFDTSWYLSQNPEAAASGINPLAHYRMIGTARKADPSLRFDVEWYLSRYQDVACSGIDPFEHFLCYGHAEGRTGAAACAPVTDAEIYCLKEPFFRREAALFVTHSPNGRVKPHLRHYLESLKRQNIDVVLIVAADAEFTESDPDLLNAVAGVFVRRNMGYDFAAWAHVLRLHPELHGVSILYLLNDSLIGPTNDAAFGDLLTKIRSSPADLIGLTESYEIAWHIQSFFVALKSGALSNPAFRRFMDGVASYGDKDKVIRQYEVRLAPRLRSAGVSCDVVFPSTTQSDNRTLFDWFGLLKAGFPFVKVMAIRDGFADGAGYDWRDVLSAEGYDVSLAERTLAEAKGVSEASAPSVPAKSQTELKALHIQTLEARFAAFLASPKRLGFASYDEPALSIILVLFNKAHFTFACLESLASRLSAATFPYEIIVYDNGSTDRTTELLERCGHLVTVRDENNLGFLQAVNAASDLARGDYMLLLNNDTELPERALENALGLISQNDDVGAVGAKLILPDGLLQEAGSIMWNDGTCLGYCRGRDPEHFEANFRRDVDYCSGAFLLTRTALFRELGRFNPVFIPAYYEETDYCLRLWEAGWRIVYDPSVVIHHFEFASAETNDAAMQLQIRNRGKFVALHEDALRRHLPPNPDNILFARQAGPRKLRLLFIDDFVPHDHMGAGFPRARKIIEGLRTAGAQITLCPTFDRQHTWKEVRKTLDDSIEVAFGVSPDVAPGFIESRAGYYDAVLVSRPHNMTPLNEALEKSPDLLRGHPLIYDAEALFTDRDIELRRLRGETVEEDEQASLIEAEMQIARFASTIFCVSPKERDRVAKRWPDKTVRVLGHMIEPRPTTNDFDDRSGILFVGAIHADYTPNADSIVWFVDRVLPLLRDRLSAPLKFVIAGLNKSQAVSQRIGADVIATGVLDDLTPLYEQCRIFVAPTRFAAGIPHKIHEAAGRGLPCVVTPLLAEQLGWTAKTDLLTGNDPEAFAASCAQLYMDARLWTRIRENALFRVKQDCSPRAFASTLGEVYDSLEANMRKREATRA